jgi:uncharacterized protein with PIN domain
MVTAIFRFYEELNDFLAPERRRREFSCPCARAATTKHMIEALGVPHTEVELILVNGESVGFEHLLRDGDRVAVYPRFEALDITPLLRVREWPLRVTRFVADAHLGGLARLLRMAGFDTLYRNDYRDSEIADVAAREGRIVLTRDRELLKLRNITHGCYVHALKPVQQLGEILNRLDLTRSLRPFTLCMDCNAPLRDIDKAQVIERLPPSVQANHERFTTCDLCGRVFWEGSHWQRLRELVDTAVQTGTTGLSDGDRQLEARLRDHVFHLAAEIGERNVGHYEALRAAAAYIRSEWQELGYAVESQTYPVGEHVCENLEIAIPGTDKADEIILAGAHYDTVLGSPGADDNASAVAALIELARMLRGAALRRSVKLVAFVNEEPPFFYFGQMGSRIYARAARARGDDIRLMLALEMLGCYSEAQGSQRYPLFLRHFYPDRGNFIAFVANLRSRQQLRQAVTAFRALSSFPCESLAAPAIIPGVAWSDHLSFWRTGYPAIMVTDTAFYRYPHYHSSFDTPEKLDYGKTAKVVTGLAGMLRRCADAQAQ